MLRELKVANYGKFESCVNKLLRIVEILEVAEEKVAKVARKIS